MVLVYVVGHHSGSILKPPVTTFRILSKVLLFYLRVITSEFYFILQKMDVQEYHSWITGNALHFAVYTT